jgi:predicted Rossmann fold flavoprotein
MQVLTKDIAIIGAGASGMLSAYFCSEWGKEIVVLDHNKQIGRKILISGGGKCNFTNLYGEARHYYCNNPHFVKSALSRYSGLDFLELIKDHKVAVEQRKFGQLFCAKSAKEINRMLTELTDKPNIKVMLEQTDLEVSFENGIYTISNDRVKVKAQSLIIATGGLVLPSIGASDFGHKLAKRFGHKIIPSTPALVPFIVEGFSSLAGNAFVAGITIKGNYHEENVLFTHKGLSGPCILKTSLFWDHGDSFDVNWLPSISLSDLFLKMKPHYLISKSLKHHLPNNFIDLLFEKIGLDPKSPAGVISKKEKDLLTEGLHKMKITPSNTEGFRKAETTRGGVDTSKISSKTMESKLQPGLFFTGEVLDVAGQLGGHNFQWCWASAHAVGSYLR